MKTLETIIFILLIILPILAILLGILNYDKIKSDRRFRTTLLKMTLLCIIVNGTLYGCCKTIDDNSTSNTDTEDVIKEKPKDDKPTQKEKPPNKTQTQTVELPPPTTPKDMTVIGTTTNGFVIAQKDGATYIDGYLIVNKSYSLPSTYAPETDKPITKDNCQGCLEESTKDAWLKMSTDAQADGITLWIASGYRSYNYQTSRYKSYVNRHGRDTADTYSARPGHSEHQSGLAFDLNDVSQEFADSKEGLWINDNCYKYGFIIRYPKEKTSETGYIYEPWHLRYVGTDLATKLYNDGNWITMETYFGIASLYRE